MEKKLYCIISYQKCFALLIIEDRYLAALNASNHYIYFQQRPRRTVNKCRTLKMVFL